VHHSAKIQLSAGAASNEMLGENWPVQDLKYQIFYFEVNDGIYAAFGQHA
jgi:hypothetical protein